MPMHNHSPLEQLASLVGILPHYIDQTGSEARATSDETRVAILGAMGIDASTPQRAAAALEAMEQREWARALAPARVVRAGSEEAAAVSIRVPEGSVGAAEWTLRFAPEGGEPYAQSGASVPEWDGSIVVPLRAPAPEGYHTVAVTVRQGGAERSGTQSLIVVPDTCPGVEEVTGRAGVFGVIANLYTVRSTANWGIGDLSDLAWLMEWTARAGGAFVGVNPLHALRNRGTDVSPYSPVSRIFRNPIYVDVAAVPGVEALDEARRAIEADASRRELEALRGGDRVEYQRVWALKRPVLEALHRAFRAAGDDRRRGYLRFVERQGEPLERYATFEALTDHHGAADWKEWPESLHDPRSAEVAAFAREHAETVDFHRWLQYELDRQLGDAAARGARAGLPVGLYQDLAIGTSPAGADVWANPGLFVAGVSIGAPPDEYSATGQNWGLPPLDPRRLRDDGYRFWIDLVRAAMRHSGALRIDHAIGLFRQFWIPEGMDGSKGAYMRFPADELLGILALEARRCGALVVGEDLGTVPPEVPPALHARGVLSSRVFYFEREAEAFRPAAEYEPMSLATANTHDMPTLAGFWAGRDIELKREVGMIESDADADEQRRAREKERGSILERLAAEGSLPAAEAPADGAALRGAVHHFLCGTPAALVGIGLDDLVGEVEPVNLPGVPPEDFQAWTRRLAVPLEALDERPGVREALRCEARALG